MSVSSSVVVWRWKKVMEMKKKKSNTFKWNNEIENRRNLYEKMKGTCWYRNTIRFAPLAAAYGRLVHVVSWLYYRSKLFRIRDAATYIENIKRDRHILWTSNRILMFSKTREF